VESRTNPGRWLVLPDLIHTIHDLDPLHRAPAGHEGARERCIREQIARTSFTTRCVVDGVEVHPSTPQFASSHAFI